MKTNHGKWYRQAAIVAACLLPLCAQPAFAERIKDLASIQGVRNNQLIGYGIVVGLDNTGDQTTQTPMTTQALGNMLSQMGVNLTTEQATKLQLQYRRGQALGRDAGHGDLAGLRQAGTADRCHRIVHG